MLNSTTTESKTHSIWQRWKDIVWMMIILFIMFSLFIQVCPFLIMMFITIFLLVIIIMNWHHFVIDRFCLFPYLLKVSLLFISFWNIFLFLQTFLQSKPLSLQMPLIRSLTSSSLTWQSLHASQFCILFYLLLLKKITFFWRLNCPFQLYIKTICIWCTTVLNRWLDDVFIFRNEV